MSMSRASYGASGAPLPGFLGFWHYWENFIFFAHFTQYLILRAGSIWYGTLLVLAASVTTR
jgi:hypothetical protein